MTSAWQQYCDQQLVDTGDVCGAAIVGLTDGAVWAARDLALKQGEGVALIALFKRKSDASDPGAFSIGGVKYLTVRADARSVYGKMVTHTHHISRFTQSESISSRVKSNTGVVCVKTGHCVVVGRYDENIQPGQAVLRVEKLGDFLIQHDC
jgi:profilin